MAGRYKHLRLLGRGSHGDVWESLDKVTGGLVAVKVLNDFVDPLRVRKEVSALRLLNIPGVVRLLDEGTDDGHQFLVMEIVRGTNFPGTPTRCSWPDLVGVTTALLETLARIHAAGVIHRDIKPSNVLVNDQGLPIVLDFGLALGAVGDHTADDRFVGTPLYMALEQFRAEVITERADLHALGVMLYEALAWQAPYQGANIFALYHQKTEYPAVPLEVLVPEVPSQVLRTIHRMLAPAASDRPASAAEVMRLLRGEATPRNATIELPRLGDHAPLDLLLKAVAARRSADLVGPHGSGRTYTLQTLGEALTARGQTVLATVPAGRPLASLKPVFKDYTADLSTGIDSVVETLATRLRTVLGDAVLIVDDAEQIDGWSERVIDRCRADGCVVRAVLEHTASDAAATVSLQPLSEIALQALFVGPERVFHFPSDAAHALWERTEGWPALVVEELAAWERAGMVRRDGETYTIDREAIDRLAAGQRIALLLRGARSTGLSIVPRAPLATHLEDLVAWLTLAWPHTKLGTVAAAMQQPEWMVEAQARDLEQYEAVRRLADGRWEPRLAVSPEALWGSAKLRLAHCALAEALKPGTEGRLVHLVLCGTEDENKDAHAAVIASEAIALARARAAEGRLGQAIVALADGLRAARRTGDPGEREVDLLAVWVELALSEVVSRPLDRVSYELQRTHQDSRKVERLRTLVAAAGSANAGGDRALDLVENLAPFEDRGLEMQRQTVRIKAARRCPLEREERAVGEAIAWAEALGDPTLDGQAADWEARLEYRKGNFEKAAELLAMAVEVERDPTRKLGFMRGLTMQLIEASQFDRADEWAQRARSLARTAGSLYAECYAEFVLGLIAYRRGRNSQPDLELVRISARIGNNDVEAGVALLTAWVAAREDQHERVIDLAGQAHQIWTTTNWLPGVALCYAVRLLVGANCDRSTGELAELALRMPPTIGLQLLALLARREQHVPEGWRVAGRRMADSLRPTPEGGRLEILSLEECLQMLGLLSAGSTDRGVNNHPRASE